MAPRRFLPAALLLLLLFVPAARPAELPRPAPEYIIKLDDGKTLELSQYKGKAVVLAFILTYCSHCQRTIGFLIQDQNEYGPRGLQVLASAVESGAQLAVPSFIKTFNPPFPVGYNDDQGTAAMSFMQHPVMKIPLMPMLAFIDRQGVIRAQYEGDDANFFGDQHEQNLRKEIEALLKPAQPVKKNSRH